jgi:hypothetical protein
MLCSTLCGSARFGRNCFHVEVSLVERNLSIPECRRNIRRPSIPTATTSALDRDVYNGYQYRSLTVIDSSLISPSVVVAATVASIVVVTTSTTSVTIRLLLWSFDCGCNGLAEPIARFTA